MKSNANAGFIREATPEPTLPAHENGSGLVPNKAFSAEAAAKITARLPRERELPLPVALARPSRAARLNSFRGFGINE